MNPVIHSRLLAVATAAAAGQMSFMTGEEGSELTALGYIVPNPSVPGPVPGSCAVSITPAGYQALQALSQAPAAQAAPPAPAVKPVIAAVRSGIAIPAPLKRGGKANTTGERKSMYPFDSLAEPGADGSCASFHVAQTADNPEPWKAVASNVSAANSRSAVPMVDPAGQPIMETVVKKTAVKGPDGKAIKGQFTEATVTQQKMQATKKFIARRVNAEDPDGPGVRVFRVPLNFE